MKIDKQGKDQEHRYKEREIILEQRSKKIDVAKEKIEAKVKIEKRPEPNLYEKNKLKHGKDF